ncbi:unnamed protein product [Allacma fusca]|uniref:Serine/threonine-protein kinase greatwall n=1 Tax=Allacma fusca TaxID=39272 RepID=A0A8J2PMH6_9HEXA|nr:unnamed protein product [Allacma fusca]
MLPLKDLRRHLEWESSIHAFNVEAARAYARSERWRITANTVPPTLMSPEVAQNDPTHNSFSIASPSVGKPFHPFAPLSRIAPTLFASYLSALNWRTYTDVHGEDIAARETSSQNHDSYNAISPNEHKITESILAESPLDMSSLGFIPSVGTVHPNSFENDSGDSTESSSSSEDEDIVELSEVNSVVEPQLAGPSRPKPPPIKINIWTQEDLAIFDEVDIQLEKERLEKEAHARRRCTRTKGEELATGLVFAKKIRKRKQPKERAVSVMDLSGFFIEGDIGDGGFGQIFLVQNSVTKKQFALKRQAFKLGGADFDLAQIQLELQIHTQGDPIFFFKAFAAWNHDDSCYMLLERMIGVLCGTPGYMAPESVLKTIYSEQSDWFSFGLIIRYFITGGQHYTFKSYEEAAKHWANPDMDVSLDLIEMPEWRDYVAKFVIRTGIDRSSYSTSLQNLDQIHPMLANFGSNDQFCDTAVRMKKRSLKPLPLDEMLAFIQKNDAELTSSENPNGCEELRKCWKSETVVDSSSRAI